MDLVVGQRCLTACGGFYEGATIQRINEDGSVDLTLDSKPKGMFAMWEGVTRGELSFDDEAQWPSVLARIGRDGTLGLEDLIAALSASDTATPAIAEAWTRNVTERLGIDAPAALEVRLEGRKAYKLLRAMGLASARFSRHDAPTPFYWNQTRMGGRAPSEVARRVTVADAIAALGIDDVSSPDAVAMLAAHEERLGITLAEELRALGTRAEVRRAFAECHPNAPNFVPIDYWARVSGPERDYVIVVEPHQGEHYWAVEVARADGAPSSGAVFVIEIDEDTKRVVDARRTADGFAFFVWDLAQTGLVWFEAKKYGGRPPFERTDIGLRRGQTR